MNEICATQMLHSMHYKVFVQYSVSLQMCVYMCVCTCVYTVNGNARTLIEHQTKDAKAMRVCLCVCALFVAVFGCECAAASLIKIYRI